MIDRIGAAVTLAFGMYFAVVRVIDQVNTWTEYAALILAIIGVVIGAARIFRRVARAWLWTEQIVSLLDGLTAQLDHSDKRMSRIEEQIGLDPDPFHSEVRSNDRR